MARIQLKRKTSGNDAPAASDLLLGELAVNTVTGKIYLRDGNNVVNDVQSTLIEVKYDSGNTRFTFNDVRPNFIRLSRGQSYLFRQTDSSNISHHLTIKDGTGGSASEYTTGVTKTVISSNQKALKFEVPLNSPDILYLWGATAAEGLPIRLASDSDQTLNTSSTPTFGTVTASTGITTGTLTATGDAKFQGNIIRVDTSTDPDTETNLSTYFNAWTNASATSGLQPINVSQLKINGVIVDLDNIVSHYDFWSTTQATSAITNSAGVVAISPTVAIPQLGGNSIIPADATISNVTLLLKWRLTTNTNTSSANSLAQNMNLQWRQTGGTYATTHTFPNAGYFTPANTSSSGEIISADLGLNSTAWGSLTT